MRVVLYTQSVSFLSLSPLQFSIVFRYVPPPLSVAKCPRTNVTVVSRTLPRSIVLGPVAVTAATVTSAGTFSSSSAFECHHNSYLEMIFLTVFLSHIA